MCLQKVIEIPICIVRFIICRSKISDKITKSGREEMEVTIARSLLLGMKSYGITLSLTWSMLQCNHSERVPVGRRCHRTMNDI